MSQSLPDNQSATARGWAGELELTFTQINNRTVLGKTRRFGPLCVQRPFYPETDICHLYLLHPPGGMAGGDKLTCQVQLEPSTHTLLTTPAAQKVYRSDGELSKWSLEVEVGANARLEWLPQDTILFGGSRWASNTQIKLETSSQYCGWEITSFGRPASNDPYKTGCFDQRLNLNIGGKPILIERFTGKAGDKSLRQQWGLQRFQAFATLFAYPSSEDLQVQLLHHLGHRQVGITVVENLLIIRILGADVRTIVKQLRHAWAIWRKTVCHIEPCVPRIWST